MIECKAQSDRLLDCDTILSRHFSRGNWSHRLIIPPKSITINKEFPRGVGAGVFNLSALFKGTRVNPPLQALENGSLR